MSKKEKTELAEVNKNAVSTGFDFESAVEAQVAQEDFRDHSSEDIITPRIRVLQSLSAQLKKSKPEYIPEAKEGMLLNTATKQLYDGAVGIDVIPCLFEKEFVEWTPQSQGGGLVKRWGTDDSFKQHYLEKEGKWINQETLTEVVKTANYYVLFIDPTTQSFTPAIISFSGTQYKKSRGWTTMIAQQDFLKADGTFVAPPPYYKVYNITTIPEGNDKGDWYGYRITFKSTIKEIHNAENAWKMATEFRKLIQEGKVKAVVEQEDYTTNDSDTL